MLVKKINNKYFIFFTLLFFIFFKSKFLSPTFEYLGDPLAYISHVCTILYDFDLDYSNEVLRDIFIDRAPPHPIGVGLLTSIFTFPFSILDRIFDNPIIQDRSQYQNSWVIFGMIISSILMFFLGTYYYLKSIKLMKVKINQILFLVIIFGTGILYYVNNVPIYSHIYEFFVLSLVLFFSLRFYKYELNYDLFLLSVALIFSLLVRYNNFNSFLIPFIIIIFETIRNENKRISNTKIFKLLFSVTLSFCIVNLVTIFVYDAYIFQFQKIYGDGASSKIFENYEILYILKKIFLVYKNFYKLIFTLEQGVIFSNPLTFFVLFLI